MDYAQSTYTQVRPEKLSQLKYSPVDAALMQFDRTEIFKEIRAHIKKKYPDFKLEYGYCNPTFNIQDHLTATMGIKEALKFNQRFIMIDYCLVYSYHDKGLKDMKCAFIICPAVASSRSLNTYALYKYQRKEKEFWDDFYISSIRFPYRVLEQYLEVHEGLSGKKYLTQYDPRTFEKTTVENEKYWKRPEHLEQAIVGISECCAEFQPDKH